MVDAKNVITTIPFVKSHEFNYAKLLPKSMEEYSNIDILVRKESVDDFFPDEFTVLKANDTIIFKWPSSLNERYLTIYNSKGELVKKATIKKKIKEFTLLPGVLKPGIYYWKFINDTTLIRITVSN